jgi:membrane protease YdiL (CAAX protease family)
MEAQTQRLGPPTSSTDPIAGVRLWLLLPVAFVVPFVVRFLFEHSFPPGYEERVLGVVVFATIIAWWVVVVAGATRRAGFRPPTPSPGAILKLSSKVAVCVIMAKVVWQLVEHTLGLPRVGLVTAAAWVPDGRTVESFAFGFVLSVLVGPTAEEMLFRGALFRKWRMRVGPGKAALITSVLFGLGHPNSLTPFISGLALAVLYTSTRTIWAPIAAHALNNALSMTLPRSIELVPPHWLDVVVEWRLQYIAFVPGVLGTWWLVRFLRRGWHTLGDPVDGVLVSHGSSPAGVGHLDGSQPRTVGAG